MYFDCIHPSSSPYSLRSLSPSYYNFMSSIKNVFISPSASGWGAVYWNVGCLLGTMLLKN